MLDSKDVMLSSGSSQRPKKPVEIYRVICHKRDLVDACHINVDIQARRILHMA